MANESVNGWDSKVLIASDASVATFGTVVAPAAAQAFECVNADLGVMEVGEVRPKRDRNLGRGMQAGFVEGRVKPIAFSLESSVKTRAANTTVPIEDAIYRAGGLIRTVGGASVTYTPDATPLATSNGFLGLSVYRAFGTAPYSYEAEQLRGGVIKTLNFSGGDKELTLKAAGEAIGKYHLGFCSMSINNVATSFTFANVEEGYRFGIGWYQCESEIIKITAMDYTTFTATIARAQLGSSAAAHAAALYPYRPAMSFSGTPISEGGTTSFTLDSVVLRVLNWEADLTTGMDLLPGETGSKYIQNAKAIRYELGITCQLVLTQEQVALLGKAKNRNTCAVSIVQSTGAAGGIFTFAAPYTEVVAFKVGEQQNDVCIVDVTLRCRDSAAGNDMFSITLT